ncbi:hypothetical protein M2651_06360 [Clostridium sp. SYSU_GA19001]|uniref:hypothetical protein n=1 Tax=Clostridium caldaquaticum TaxID=2940653 RepID=UPI002077471A|nr:hypothetical protein [Clostridium caldaquaticum]MCM8710651.1 hypothetical protein [Clostridium caldaquaticum]
MSKTCIFYNDKLCNDCNECFICDLNANKKCNNCGKCLELEGYDMRAINIDEIFDDESEFNEYEYLDKIHNQANISLSEDSEQWDYIDDIKELKELFEEDKELSVLEEFPGLISINKKEK